MRDAGLPSLTTWLSGRSARLPRRQALSFLAGGAALAGLAALAGPGRAGQSRGAADSNWLPTAPSASVGETATGEPRTAEEAGQSAGQGHGPLRVFYSDSYVLAAHSFETTRKARWVAESLDDRPLPELRIVAPDSLTDEEVKAVHAPHYVDAVRTGQPRALAQSQGFTWDPGLWTMVLASNGGAVAAAVAALQDGVAGSLSSGLHHAHYDHGKGFCTFNGLVLAARAAQAAGARRLLILDLDAHCGGGTHALLGGDPAIRVVDVAVNSFDSYRPAPHNSLDLVRAAADYLPTISARLDRLAAEGARYDLCLYNAGMDPHQDCPVGGLRGITTDILAERERLVFEWCRGQRLPVAFVLAGGYTGPPLDQRGLVDLHRFTLAAASGSL